MRKLKLLIAAFALILGAGQTWAQTDVTSTYLNNADFSEGTLASPAICTYVKDTGSNNTEFANLVALDSWTAVDNGDGKAGGPVAIGSGVWIGGSGYTAPPTNSDGEVTGNVLGLVACWNASAQYTQNIKQALPAGTYTIVLAVYNSKGGTNAIDKNLIGFKESGGTEHFASTKQYPVNTWKYEFLTFTLTDETSGYISLGYKSTNTGSGNMPHLFVSGLEIYEGSVDADAYAAAKEAIRNAKELAANKERLAGSSYATPSDELLVNGSFDTANQGWTLTNMGYQANQERPTRYVEKWQSSALTGSGSASQTIKNMPAGAYVFTGFANTNKDENGGAMINVGLTSVEVSGTWKEYKVIYNHENDGDLTVSFTYNNLASNWIAIDEFSLVYGGEYTAYEAAMHKGDWDLALAAAEAAIADAAYANVTGKEKSDLQVEIAKAEPTTAEGYDDAAEALTTATQAFIAAKTNYDIFATYNTTLDYADAAKAPEITNESTATSIITALRAYYESNALAEGVAGAVDYTSAVSDANADTNTGWTNGLGTNSGQGYTDANGTVAEKYLDGGWASNAGANIDMTREVTLPAGTYLLTVIARGSSSLDTYTLSIGGQTVNLPTIGNVGGVFNNGWNDVSVVFETTSSPVTLEVIAQSTASQQWMSINRFRLVQLEANNDIALHKQAWEEAKTAAETARDNSDYENVTGSERTDLEGEIEKAEPTTAEGYDNAATALTTATATFIAAKAAYDELAALWSNGVPELVYALTAKYTAIGDAYFGEGEVVNAADASARTASMKTAIRAYYESHALAEKVEGAVNCADAIAGADPETNTGWTGGIGTDNRSWEQYTDASGNAGGRYYDGGWSTNAGVNINMSRSIEIPAGTYLLTVTARGSENLTSYTMSVSGETIDLPGKGSGENVGVFGHGWDDVSVEFTTDGHPVTLTIAATSTEYQQWISFNRFRLMRLELNTSVYAGETEYTALNNAISVAEAKTLGFEDGQYAPYNNVAALEALAAAKAIDQTATLTNLKSDVEAATTALTSATWTPNSGDVDAIYNGMFNSEVENDWGLTGWTRTNSWGQQRTGIEGIYTTAYYNQPGSLVYGSTGAYTMPLAANQAYKLTFVYRSHEDNSNKGVTASVLNEGNEGLTATTFAGNGSKSVWKTVEALFNTGAAGNYVLTLANSGNTWITNVSLVKVDNATIAISEDADYSLAETYANVTFNRTVVEGWNGMVLPFDMSIDDVMSTFSASKVKDFVGITYDATDGVTLDFEDATEVKAGKPFLMKAAAGTSYTINGVILPATALQTIEKTDENNSNIKYTMTGSYAASTNLTDVSFALINGNQYFYHPAGANTSSAKAFRAWFVNGSTEPTTARVSFNFGDDTVTGISNAMRQANTENSEVYNLQGQRVMNAQKGLFIQNGKKVVIK